MKITVILVLFMTIGSLSSQTVDWGWTIGDSETDAATAVSYDTDNNIITAGNFAGTMDADPGSGTAILSSNGYNDIYIQKLDADGNFLWARSIGGLDFDTPYSVGITSDNKILISGSFEGTVDFDPGLGITNQTAISKDIFLLKLSAEGEFEWVFTTGSSENDYGLSLTTDELNNTYVTGRYNNFSPPPVPGNSRYTFESDIFILKVDESGDLQWMHVIGGPGFHYGTAVAVNNANVVVTGRFQETVDFNPGIPTENRTSNGGSDAFLLNLDADGGFQWVRTYGGNNRELGRGLDIDNTGAIYTMGMFNETVDFDPGSSVFELTAIGSDNLYIQKLDNLGEFIWAAAILSNGGVIGYGMTLDQNNNPIIIGQIDEATDFDPGPGDYTLESIGWGDIFVLNINTAGEFLGAFVIGSTNAEEGLGLDMNTDGNLLICGRYFEEMDFDPSGTAYNLVSNGSLDGFVIKYNSEVLGQSDVEIPDFNIFPNPAGDILNIEFKNESAVEISIYSISGSLVRTINHPGSETINISTLASGLYVMQLTFESTQVTYKFIKE